MPGNQQLPTARINIHRKKYRPQPADQVCFLKNQEQTFIINQGKYLKVHYPFDPVAVLRLAQIIQLPAEVVLQVFVKRSKQCFYFL
jgi:hypothetical protein